MKIADVRVYNTGPVNALHVELLDHPIHLFVGPNEQGKTTLLDCVRWALTGELPRGLAKKELSALLHDGAEKGAGSIALADGETGWYELPSGECQQIGGLNRAQRVALAEGHRFASLRADERRAVLLQVSGVSMDAAAINERLIAKGLDENKVQQLANRIGASVESAAKEAAALAREAKASWRTVTGETWGAVKSGAWSAPVATLDEQLLSDARTELAEVDAVVGALRETIGGTKARIEAAAKGARERAGLHASASLLDRRLKAHEAAVARLDEQATMLERLRGAVVHSTADDEPSMPLLCPECNTTLAYENGALIRYPEQPEAAEAAEAERTDALSKLPAAKKALETCQRAAANAERDLKQSQEAASKLSGCQTEDIDLDAELAAQNEQLAERSDYARTLRAQTKAIEEASAANARAADRTKQAAGYHADVLAWEAIAEALSPSGVQAELMGEAMLPITTRLAEYGQITGWGDIAIDSDMRITRNGIHYACLSPSGQWRVDAIINAALSYTAGLGLLMLDGADVLDLRGRSQLVRWLAQIAQPQDTILVTMTLKEPPKRVPPGVVDHWIGPSPVAMRAAA